jgi:hypothetical protein
MTDLENVAAYEAPIGETCDACRKLSDATKVVKGLDGAKVTLCGTHFDEWLLQVPEQQALWKTLTTGPDSVVADRAALYASAFAFAQALRAGKYKPCWDAEAP